MLRNSQEIISVTHPLLEAEPKQNDCLATTTKFLLGGIGVGAGILYLGPAEVCSTSIYCGQWLNNLITRYPTIAIFTAGGLDFSAGAVYMGAQSAEATIQYLKASPTLSGKMGKGTLVVFFAASQNIPLLLTSITVSPALWHTILTVGGAIPGTVFGAVNMLQRDIPYWTSRASVHTSNLSHCVLNVFYERSFIEKLQWDRIIHYRKQHEKFLEQLNTRFKDLITRMQTIEIDASCDPILFLFKQNIINYDHSYFALLVHHLGTIAGFLLAQNLCAGFISNTLRIISKYVPTLPLQVISTVLVSLSTLYGHSRLTIDGVHALLDTFVDVLRGKPIQSTMFQLQPKTMFFVAGFSIAASVLSYAVIAVVFIQEFKNDNNITDNVTNSNTTYLDPTRQGFLFGAMTGIDIYHFASLLHLYRLIFSALTRDEKAQFICRLEQEVERFNYMTESEFIKFIESNTPDKNLWLELNSYQEHEAAQVINSEATDLENSMDFEPVSEIKPRSSFGKWCNWFSCCHQSDAVKEQIIEPSLKRLSA